MKLSFTIYTGVLSLLLTACSSQQTSGDFNVITLDDNPDILIDISEATDVRISTIGILDFRVVDSTLIISTQADRGMWQLYKLPECDSITSILDIGGGPYETMEPVPLLYTSLTTDKAGHHLINFFERATGKLINIDITGITHNSVNNAIHEEYGQPVSTMDIYSFKMNNGDIYKISIDMGSGRIKRSILHGNTDITPKTIQFVNNKYKADDISLLSDIASYPLISHDCRYVADIKSSGWINIFDIEQDCARSIMFGNNGHDNNIQILPGHAYDNFFTVTRISKENNFTRLDFVGWDGSIYRTIEINSTGLRSIDVDLNTETLYAVDPENDKLISLPIHPTE